MIKLKILAIASVLMIAGIVSSGSRSFSTLAKSDVLQEIAGYKSWSKITKEPIKVSTEFTIDGRSGAE